MMAQNGEHLNYYLSTAIIIIWGNLHFLKMEFTRYFASDMPGGGKDIWMTKNENGAWGTPVNISSTNTAGDEMFPYIAPKW